MERIFTAPYFTVWRSGVAVGRAAAPLVGAPDGAALVATGALGLSVVDGDVEQATRRAVTPTARSAAGRHQRRLAHWCRRATSPLKPASGRSLVCRGAIAPRSAAHHARPGPSP